MVRGLSPLEQDTVWTVREHQSPNKWGRAAVAASPPVRGAHGASGFGEGMGVDGRPHGLNPSVPSGTGMALASYLAFWAFFPEAEEVNMNIS